MTRCILALIRNSVFLPVSQILLFFSELQEPGHGLEDANGKHVFFCGHEVRPKENAALSFTVFFASLTRLDGKHLDLIRSFKSTLSEENPSCALLPLKTRSRVKYDNEGVKCVGELEHFHFIHAIMQHVLTSLRALFHRIEDEPSPLTFCAFHCHPLAVNISLLLSLPGRKFGAYVSPRLRQLTQSSRRSRKYSVTGEQEVASRP